MTTNKIWAVVPAAGVGKRMQSDRPKQYLPLAGATVIEQTLQRLLTTGVFSAVAVAISAEDPYWPKLAICRNESVVTAPGGKERSDSVLSALRAIDSLAAADDWVLVHDAARPCITAYDIHALLETLAEDAVGGILALPSHDTLKDVDGREILGTHDRRQIWRALTPQMFRYGMLEAALDKSVGNPLVTDEASALELEGYRPKIVEGRPDNLKITRPEDLALAEFYLQQQANGA